MGQTEDVGQRPPDPEGETANRAMPHVTGVTTGSAADDAAGDAEPGSPGDPARQAGRHRPATGDPRVDAVLARLDELEGLPVTEHRAVFEDVHRRLRDVLGELDTGQPRGAGDAAGRPGR
jgi:hypothetical protein